MASKEDVKGVGGINIVVGLPQKAIAGEAIDIKLTLQNDSNEEIRILTVIKYQDFSIEIKNPSGTAIPKTRFGQLVIHNDDDHRPHNYHIQTLSRGQKYQADLNIARLFDLTIADTYTISISRMITETASGKNREVSANATLAIQEPPVSFEPQSPKSMR
jgi:hypothetical protein